MSETSTLTCTNNQLYPIWLLEWYKENNIINEDVLEYINKKKNIESYKKDELDVASSLISMKNSEKNTLKKRCAPKAQKMCSVCTKEFTVNSAKQSCLSKSCKGLLVLIHKPEKEVKRKAPRCKKKMFQLWRYFRECCDRS